MMRSDAALTEQEANRLRELRQAITDAQFAYDDYFWSLKDRNFSDIARALRISRQTVSIKYRTMTKKGWK